MKNGSLAYLLFIAILLTLASCGRQDDAKEIYVADFEYQLEFVRQSDSIAVYSIKFNHPEFLVSNKGNLQSLSGSYFQCRVRAFPDSLVSWKTLLNEGSNDAEITPLAYSLYQQLHPSNFQIVPVNQNDSIKLEFELALKKSQSYIITFHKGNTCWNNFEWGSGWGYEIKENFKSKNIQIELAEFGAKSDTTIDADLVELLKGECRQMKSMQDFYESSPIKIVVASF